MVPSLRQKPCTWPNNFPQNTWSGFEVIQQKYIWLNIAICDVYVSILACKLWIKIEMYGEKVQLILQQTINMG